MAFPAQPFTGFSYQLFNKVPHGNTQLIVQRDRGGAGCWHDPGRQVARRRHQSNLGRWHPASRLQQCCAGAAAHQPASATTLRCNQCTHAYCGNLYVSCTPVNGNECLSNSSPPSRPSASEHDDATTAQQAAIMYYITLRQFSAVWCLIVRCGTTRSFGSQ